MEAKWSRWDQTTLMVRSLLENARQPTHTRDLDLPQRTVGTDQVLRAAEQQSCCLGALRCHPASVILPAGRARPAAQAERAAAAVLAERALEPWRPSRGSLKPHTAAVRIDSDAKRYG